MIRDGIRRVFALTPWARRRPTDDVDEEIRAHFDLRVDQLRARGLSDEQARVEAARRFGSLESSRRQMHEAAAVRNRRLRLREQLDAFMLDARYALRGLVNAPAFSAGVIITLALGVGVNAAVFRVLDRLLLREPAGIVDASRLLHVVTVPATPDGFPRERFSYPQAKAVAATSTFASSAIYTVPRSDTLADGREVLTSTIGPGYVEIAGVRPALGRFFSENELRPLGGIRSAVLAYAFWEREMGADPAAIGRSITFSGATYRVIGVAQRDFAGVDLNPVDLWIPLGVGRFGRGTIDGREIPWYEIRMTAPLSMVARLREGASVHAVQSEAQARLAADAMAEGSMTRRAAPSVAIRTFAEMQRAGPSANGVEVLTRIAGVSALVLLLACANVTTLLLLRSRRRRREIAVRLAMGMSRGRLMRQVATEIALLTTISGCFAALTSAWAAGGLRVSLFPTGRWTDSRSDPRVLIFVGALSILVAAAVALVPVLDADATDVGIALKGAERGGRTRRVGLREGLVVVQTALSVVLLVGTGLFVRSLQRLSAIDLGMAPAALVTAYPSRPISQAPRTAANRRDVPSIRELETLVRSWPGVVATAQASHPLFDATMSLSLSIPGNDALDAPGEISPVIIGVTPEYFRVVGMRVLRGRAIAPSDAPGTERVVVVNRVMAQRTWPERDALGECLKIGGRDAPCSRVVGIVEDLRDDPSAPDAPRRYYVPLNQAALAGPAQALIIRTASGAAATAVATRLRGVSVNDLAPTVDVIERRVSGHLRSWRIGTALFGSFGVLALLLAAVGLTSVLLYSVGERAREIGIRMAVGASRAVVVASVFRDGMTIVGVGLAIGVVVAVVAARAMSALVFDVSVFDGFVYAASALVLTVVAAIGASLPALRASRVDPVVALRVE
jgi:predicted permease